MAKSREELSMYKYTPRKEFFHGMRDMFPLLLGAFPFGLIYGALAITVGMSKVAAILMPIVVFAGSAQFIALGLYAAGTPVAIIVLTTFIVNFRHLLYSATLLPHMQKMPQRWRVPLAFWLTDETFAVTVIRYNKNDQSKNKHWYQLGSSVAMYINWQFWCNIGIFLSSRISDARSWGLDFAMPVTFIGMIIPFVKSIPMVVSVLTAGVGALLFYGLPFNLGMITSALLAIAAGIVTERTMKIVKPEITGE